MSEAGGQVEKVLQERLRLTFDVPEGSPLPKGPPKSTVGPILLYCFD